MGIVRTARSVARRLVRPPQVVIGPTAEELDSIRFAIGAIAARGSRTAATLRDAEFKCFSQNGEDGIIQWLVSRVPIAEPMFVEFGVGDYRESNTRFLLLHDNWRGLILDSGSDHIQTAQSGELGWKFALEARTAFITAENVEAVLADVPADLGLLSIDIDGNDYWVLAALARLRPRIVIVEYNSVLGFGRAVAVPYDPAFDRSVAHHTWIYSGASIAAFCHWARQHGYVLVGSNAAGNNAFFVRDDVADAVPHLSAEQGWVRSRFGRPRERDGTLSHVDSHTERRRLIAEMPLVDVETGASLHVRDLSH